MALESGSYIPELDDNNPLGADAVSAGDDHIRLLKRCVTGSFPAFVGTAAAPKSVALTEDQLNDAALKSGAETITGDWIISGAWVFNSTLTAGDGVSVGGEGTLESLRCYNADQSKILTLRHDNARARLITNADDIRLEPENGKNVFINDRSGVERLVGFRNPGTRVLAANGDVLQADEGQIIDCTAALTLGLPNLEANTTVTIKNTGVGVVALSPVGTLNWLSGGATLTGARSLEPGSVCQLQYTATGVMDLWGNGLS